METKKCSKCKQEKPLNEFYKNRGYKDGLHYWCKKCESKQIIYRRIELRKLGLDKKWNEIFKKEKEKKDLFNNGLKLCKRCKEIKNINEFYKNSNCVTDGHLDSCIQCVLLKQREYSKLPEVKEKIRLSGIKYRKENKEKKKITDKEYSKTEKGIEVRKKSRAKWIKKNPDKNKQSKIDWKERNPENKKEYYEKNKDEIIQKQLEQRRNDPHKKVRHNVSSLMQQRLKKRALGKGGKSTFDFLPYTLEELIAHLEGLWEPWMNWDNYGNKRGNWSIDHIIADCKFNYKKASLDDKEFQECWALKNLQPLDHIENLRKNRY